MDGGREGETYHAAAAGREPSDGRRSPRDAPHAWPSATLEGMSLRPSSFVGLALVLSLAACGGPSKHDLYMQGMKIEGEASRGECKLVYDPAEKNHVLDGDQIHTCLRRTEEALALYEQAKALGLRDLDFVQTYERAQERQRHLESMLKTVRSLERPEDLGPGLPPPAT